MKRDGHFIEEEWRLGLLPVLALLIACGAEPPGDDDPSDETPPTAAEYCEATREMFCAYYLRCGRMSAASHEDCLQIFDESCAARYQPRYLALENAGKLALSSDGIEACGAHLESVDCAQQIFDLDRDCSGVWEGLVESDGPCGLGVESFVCQEGTMCVVGLDLCGTCRPTVFVGEPCGTDIGRCDQAASCVDGVCVSRALPNEACGAEAPCMLGATCIDGQCSRFEVVDVGEACGQNRRCAYNALCVGGLCHPQAGLGEACQWPGQCRSGYCDTQFGECSALRAPLEPCAADNECVSGLCAGESCSSLISACFD